MPIVPKWECGECHEIHDFEDEAIDCCRPDVFEVYCCPICNEAHEDEEDALHCCNAEVAAELTVDDGLVFPKGITDPATYVKEFCEANKLRM